jgi:hypothetical protein
LLPYRSLLQIWNLSETFDLRPRVVKSSLEEPQMAEISSVPGGAKILLSDGLEVSMSGFNIPPDVRDLRRICTAMFSLVENLDNRLSALEKEKK